jgi:cell division protease FtsH
VRNFGRAALPNQYMKRDSPFRFFKPDAAEGRQRATPATAGQTDLPPGRAWLLFALALFVNYLLMTRYFPGADAPLSVPYTVFKHEVGKGNVKSIYSRGVNI